MFSNSFKLYRQLSQRDCGATCLRMIFNHYGQRLSAGYLSELSGTDKTGISMLEISRVAQRFGYGVSARSETLKELELSTNHPSIVHWNKSHFIVVYKITMKFVYVADPAIGKIRYSHRKFREGWLGAGDKGYVMYFSPPDEQKLEESLSMDQLRPLDFVLNYLKHYKKAVACIVFGLLLGSIIQLILPFLTQNLVDTGIRNKEINFIYLVILGQLSMFIGKTSVDFYRNHILTHISARVNISILSDFFGRLMKLPLSYFDRKLTGDILQRIADHQRIEQFLTSGTLSAIFSFFSLIVFGIVLFIYSYAIFFIFLVMSLVYVYWLKYFLPKRNVLDNQRFRQLAISNEKNVELLYGMQEIKLHNAEEIKKRQWEQTQYDLFEINLERLKVNQLQSGGSLFINEFKNILISFIAARLVINDSITLGAMLSITYINGQLNQPLVQLVDFIKSFQEAKLSIERIQEINQIKSENAYVYTTKPIPQNSIPESDITLNNVHFRYSESELEKMSLKNINLILKSKKITAIVGASGSGKTTLAKVLLRFYQPTYGNIHIGDIDINSIPFRTWRESCGTVLQDGYIFNDTIANNISIGQEDVDIEDVSHAANIACIADFIESLPLKYDTKIGSNGLGLSSGQRQRILIARAVFKKPKILFLDEATSALDAVTEKKIVKNLKEFFTDRMVIIIAHRLSTVRYADNIVVMDDGKIVEIGEHEDLLNNGCGAYATLVHSQI
ncbi:peptidase domain-containing ABC transporter [Olivibacter sp. XZL3]|uniref:peptidase domain-containing ABC transporter n=1 Tax=Olivibacter sp. XZL3 TaxID=1735116 RepID=UPI001065F169|nr:peptidase domain-containing ABC transporter [Olivibacter sp. XZL3]